jgi:hypothetical protein
MSLTEPITVAASAPTPALTFKTVRMDGYGSEKWDVANGYQLTFNHSSSPSTGERHYMKISQTLNATSPYTGDVSKQTANVSISASFPAFGWDASTKAALVKALTDTLADADVTTANWLAFNS